MKCPYCAKRIADAATACSYCGRELFYGPLNPIIGRVSALEKETSRMTERLDTMRPLNQKVVEERLSEVEKQIATLIDQPNAERPRHDEAIEKRERQDNRQVGQQQNRQKDRGVSLTDERVALTGIPLLRSAGRYVIDNLTTAKAEWKPIGFAVFFAVLFGTISNLIGNLVGWPLGVRSLTGSQSHPLQAAIWALGIFAAVFQAGLLIFPFVFGFRTSLAWPGRGTGRRLGYVSLGLLAGVLMWSANVLVAWLGGKLLGIPTTDSSPFYAGLKQAKNWWDYTVFTFFTTSSSMFISGALLADSIKRPKFSHSQKEKTLLVTVVGKLPAIVVAMIPVLIKSFAEPVKELLSRS